MAVKTITIDMEAYELLSAEKKGKESFSQVIKRRLRKPSTASFLLKQIHRISIAEDTLDRIEEVIERRSDSIASSPRLDG